MTELWKHQECAVKMLRTQPGVMIAHDMGTGKSCTVISYLNSTDYSRVLIVCPLSVGPAWIKQFKLHGDGKIKPFLLQGSVAEKTNHAKMVVQTGSRVALIVNYESAWREPLRAFLLGLDADVVVADEIHRIKSPGSKVSWFFKNLGKKTGKRIGLTGTPMPHSPLDIYAQFRFLDIGVFGSSFNFFKRRYCEMGGYGGYEVKKFIRQEEMNARIYSITHRVKKEDVLDLPEVIHEERYCTLGKDAVKIYLALKKDFIADLDSGQITAANALVRLLRFQQLTGGFVKNDEGVTRQVDKSKITAFSDLLNDLPPEPLVVFCRFRADIGAIKEETCKNNRTCAELSGSVNELQAWQDGGSDTLVVQIQSGGLGIDLTRARYCVYYSLGFSLGEYEQSLARVHRPGQTKKVTYFHLIAENTIDERVYESLQKKKDAVVEILETMKGDQL